MNSMIVNSGLCFGEMPSLRNTLPMSYTFSMPPTMQRLRNSSTEMRRYSSRSSALWWVVNGREPAPPASDCSAGVSTSMKLRSFSHLRISNTIVWRLMNRSRVSSLASRSSSR